MAYPGDLAIRSWRLALAIVLSAGLSFPVARAAVSPEETQQLKSTLTPMVAQSFEDASLISIGSAAVVAVCEPAPPDPMFETDESEDPPPQAVSVATIAPHTAKLSFLVSISLSLWSIHQWES